MKKKSILSIAIIAAMLFAGCGSEQAADNDDKSDKKESSAATESVTESSAATESVTESTAESVSESDSSSEEASEAESSEAVSSEEEKKTMELWVANQVFSFATEKTKYIKDGSAYLELSPDDKTFLWCDEYGLTTEGTYLDMKDALIFYNDDNDNFGGCTPYENKSDQYMFMTTDPTGDVPIDGYLLVKMPEGSTPEQIQQLLADSASGS